MRRAVLCVVVAVFSLGVAACGGSSGSSAQTRTVQVDNTTGKYNGSFLAYFPNDVTVHPGDTVDFHENWTGEPHTVTMGTLVDAGLKAVQAAGPNAQNGPPPDERHLSECTPPDEYRRWIAKQEPNEAELKHQRTHRFSRSPKCPN